jgi:tetratricopeptide (TPR) repeat protein
MFSILQYLTELEEEHGLKVHKALKCLKKAFDLDISDERQRAALKVGQGEGAALGEIFAAGKHIMNLEAKENKQHAFDVEECNLLWNKFMSKLVSKGFFKDEDGKEVQDGTEEHAERHMRALAQFAHKRFALRDYEGCIFYYDKALALSETNVAAHRASRANYLSNRAAAQCHLERFEAAIESCDEALSLEPEDSKAWSRKGLAHLHLEQFKEAVEAYERAVALDPCNISSRESLLEARESLAQEELGPRFSTAGRASSGGLAGRGSIGGGGLRASRSSRGSGMNMQDVLSSYGSNMGAKSGSNMADIVRSNPNMRKVASGLMQSNGRLDAAANP